MNKRTFLHAVAAEGYIFLIASAMNFFSKHTQQQDIFLTPVVVLTLFTLSAAVMGYLFAFKPIQLYLDGKKAEGVRFFFHTVGFFALITAIVLVIFITITKI
jgi:hypothetical protein